MKVKSKFSAALSDNRRRLLFWSPVVLAVVAVAAVAVTIWMLYLAAYQQQKAHLVEMAENQCSLLEAIGKSNGWNERATLNLLNEVRTSYQGLGKTGEFVIAHTRGNKIFFLMHHSHGEYEMPRPISLDGKLAEPMRRALRGEEGTVVGLDCHGHDVLAAFCPVPDFNWGLVAKTDLSEIRAPFIKATVVAVMISLVLAALGSFLLVRLALPVVAELEASNRLLVQERNRAREYFNIAGTILLVLDKEGNIVLLNRKGCEVLQYGEGALVGKNWFQTCLPESVREKTKNVFQHLMAGHISPVEKNENDVLTKSGELRTIMWHNAVVKDEEGDIVGTLTSGEDVTDWNLAAKERESLIDHLEAQNAELERFTYVVSHDLKSPLITIKGYLGMLEQDLGNEDHARVEGDINRIGSAADRMADLLDELLELSRVGRIINPSEDVPLASLVQEVLEITEFSLTQKKVDVIVEANLPVVHGDRARLREVIQNLIENAAKYMGDQPNPCIQIDACEDEEGVLCCIRDNGMGIDPRFHEKIFGLFDKLDQQTEGTGIGLALVKRIVEVHGGRIWVESDGTGHGSCFCFTLPNKDETRKTIQEENHDRRTTCHSIG